MKKTESVPSELSDVAKEISSQTIRDTTHFHPAAYSTVWDKRGKLQERLLNMKELRLNGVENSQVLQGGKWC